MKKYTYNQLIKSISPISKNVRINTSEISNIDAFIKKANRSGWDVINYGTYITLSN